MSRVLVLCLVVCFSLRGEAQVTLNVPSTFPTIQSAITAANNFDVVHIAPGVFVENIDFIGKRITVRGTPGFPGTEIVGSNGGSTVTFSGGEINGTFLQDLTIRGGTGSPNALGDDGGGIFMYNAWPTIERCVIRNNTLTAIPGGRLRGGGIFAHDSSPILRDCLITLNFLDGSAGPLTQLAGGGCFFSGVGSPRFERTTVTGNIVFGEGPVSGGGIHLEQDQDALLVECDISANSIGSPTNPAPALGGGLYVDGRLIQIRRCTINDNSVSSLDGSGSGGGGVYFGNLTQPSLSNIPQLDTCVVARNVVSTGRGGGVLSEMPVSVFLSVTVTANSAGPGQDVGGLVYTNSAQGTVLINSISWNNTPGNLSGPLPPNALFNCDIGGLSIPAANVFSADPLFVNATSGDYRIRLDSPCRDTGGGATSFIGDLEGDPRAFGLGDDIGADEYVGLYACGESRVGAAAAGGPFDVLEINGSVGDHTRRVQVGVGAPFTIAVQQAPTNPAPMRFYLALFFGFATPDLSYPLPAGLGDFCFPLPLLAPGFPLVFDLTSNFGPLPSQLVMSTPAPWGLAGPGFPVPLTMTLQGIAEESPGVVKVTNGVILEVE